MQYLPIAICVLIVVVKVRKPRTHTGLFTVTETNKPWHSDKGEETKCVQNFAIY